MTKTQAIAGSARNGGPEVLEYVDVDLPPPSALTRSRFGTLPIGLNFIDVYFRDWNSISPRRHLPFIAGQGSVQASVTAIGPGVSTISQSVTAVAYAACRRRLQPVERNVEAKHLVKVPDDDQPGNSSRDDAEGHDRRISAEPDIQGRS